MFGLGLNQQPLGVLKAATCLEPAFGSMDPAANAQATSVTLIN